MLSGLFVLAVHKSSKSLKYNSDSSNMICRNTFSISAENTYICKRNRINTLNKLSVSDGPGNKQSFRDGLFRIFELAS